MPLSGQLPANGLPVTGGEVLEAVVVVAIETLGLREHLHGVFGVALEEELEAVF